MNSLVLILAMTLSSLMSLPMANASVSADDFFCLPEPYGFPAQFTMQAKTCTDARGVSTTVVQPVCSMQARCTFMDEKQKNTVIKNSAGALVHLRELSAVEKTAYFQDLYHGDYKAGFDGVHGRWQTADLICKKTSESDECPLPQDCKGDILYDLKTADFAHPAVDDLVDHASDGTSRVFEHQGDGARGAP